MTGSYLIWLPVLQEVLLIDRYCRACATGTNRAHVCLQLYLQSYKLRQPPGPTSAVCQTNLLGTLSVVPMFKEEMGGSSQCSRMQRAGMHSVKPAGSRCCR